MATGFVQAVSVYSASTPIVTGSLTTTSGNALAAAISIYNGSANVLSSFVDSKSNTWTQVAHSPQSIGVSNIQIAVYTATNITGGAGHTFTATNSVPGNGGTILVAECSGCSNGSLVRASQGAALGGGATSHAGATVTAGAGDIVLAFSTDDIRATDAFTAGLGLTSATGGSITVSQPGFIQYAANVAAGNITGAYTTTQFAAYAQVIVALFAAASGSANQQQMMMGVG
jgi:hypothetical protein